jgi:uncharacterized protein YdeI (YjbR/CyaY-like superfamily)
VSAKNNYPQSFYSKTPKKYFYLYSIPVLIIVLILASPHQHFQMMIETHKNFPAYYFENINKWETWLSENHNSPQNIWLIFYKKNMGITSLNHAQALEIGLCWGWIDSTINQRDEDSYYLFFAKRNPKNNWSKVNKEKVELLLAKNKLRTPGLAMVEHAKKTGTWNALNDVENLIIPHHLKIEFDKNTKALENFEAFPHSSKRATLEWLFNAKRVETRLKRVQKIVEMSANNEQIF